MSRVSDDVVSHYLLHKCHFLLCCPKYSVIRQKHLSDMQWHNICKFNKLLSSLKQKVLINLCIYSSGGYSIRNDVISLDNVL